MRFGLPVVALASVPMLLLADEGMWTFDNPPLAQLQSKYRFTPTKEWLDHLRLSSLRMNDGGSGSFVSPHGLVLTNHHVARGQLQKSSTAQRDYIRDGFYAATAAEEIKAPDLEVNVLMSMENVTAEVQKAVAGTADPQKALAARKDVIARLERKSLSKTGLRSDVVSLYQGGEYWLYRYKKYTDLRIVFAPEQQIAFFGGDPDNFTYPRYDLDMALFRVYENDKPIDSPHYLKWGAKGAADGELVLVSGNPASTSRQDTMAQILTERDVTNSLVLELLRSRIETLERYSARGSEEARQAGSLIFGLQNGSKVYEGRIRALGDPRIVAKKQAEEDDFRNRVSANPEWRKEFGGAWDEIALAEKKNAGLTKQQFFHRLDSQLAGWAFTLVQYVTEVAKPDGERLPGYHEAQLESLRFGLLSPAPVYPAMEEARLTGGLQQSARQLGPDNPWLKTVLAGRTPEAAAQYMVRGTKLMDAAVRKSLLEGGPAAIAASQDPMIVTARAADPLWRQAFKQYETEVRSVESAAGEKLGKARFLVYGKSAPPDATFTLRLSYGTVAGYPMNGTIAPPTTTMYGLYDRAASFGFTGPFALPSRWSEGRSKLDLGTTLNFVSTCDIIGGNSGSPVVNREGELVGLIFDGNIESLAGDFVYEPATNRAVSVQSTAMVESLRKLYGAEKLADELQGK